MPTTYDLTELKPVETPARAERLRVSLQPRVLGRAGIGEDKSYRLLYLERGNATVRLGDAHLALTGPVLGWFPWSDTQRIEIAAGSNGSHILLGNSSLERALRHKPEAAALRMLASRPALLPIDHPDPTHDAVASCLSGIITETQHPSELSAAVIDSLLHVLLILLLRGQPRAQPGPDPRGNRAIATGFVSLVELHFREGWSAQRYAQRLGVSRDRLNDICLRAYGRPPGALIRARLHQEARLYLENAPLSLDQIAGLLGFSSTPQFNRFFRQIEGQPPGRYRDAVRRTSRDAPAAPTAPYAWP